MTAMQGLKIHLFGKFNIESDEQSLSGFNGCKVQELFSYLLLYRDRPHARESLAGLLWGDSTTEKSKKYLRQSLWHLQAALETGGGQEASGKSLSVEHDWVQLNTNPSMWLDISVFEQAYKLVQGVHPHDLSPAVAERLQATVELYRGDLLEGWYQDWCLYERELFQNKYLMMLDKLLGYCVLHQEYEMGQRYGSIILRYDRARERTYRLLMRLQYLAGDRTGALRQYQRCAAALRQELGVQPDKRTVALYEEMCADRLNMSISPIEETMSNGGSSLLPEVLSRLRQLQSILASSQQHVQQDIKAIELGLKTYKH
jgi:DNA-binding transcriptional activator of the SARP family